MASDASIRLLIEPSFQWWVFIVVSVINLVLGWSGVIGKTTAFCIDAFVTEFVLMKRGPLVGQSLDEAIRAAKAQDREDFGVGRPLGKVVGVIEREIYLYALLTPIHGLITAVLLFKAFSGWLRLGDTSNGDDKDQLLEETGKAETKGLRTLARYYSYAIGNFISVAWALLMFEGIRVALQQFPILQKFLLIGVAATT